MAKTKKNKYQDPVDKIEKNIENISETIDKLTSTLGPLMNFRDLGKKIEDLKDLTPTKENMEHMVNASSENEGETCMHGNSWNSECSDCNSMDAFDHIIVLSDEYPNDAEFGEKVRSICSKYNKMMDNTEE